MEKEKKEKEMEKKEKEIRIRKEMEEETRKEENDENEKKSRKRKKRHANVAHRRLVAAVAVLDAHFQRSSFRNTAKDITLEPRKLYLNYKALCRVAYDLDILKPIKQRKKKVAYLRKCREHLVKAYNARMEHHNYAFALECRDFGHELQFKIIQKKIDKCDEELQQLLPAETSLVDEVEDEYESEDEKGDEEEEEKEEKKEKIETQKRKKKSARGKCHTKHDDERAILEYAKENRALMEKRGKNLLPL